MAEVDVTAPVFTLTLSGIAGFPVVIETPPFELDLTAAATTAPYVYVVDSGNNRVNVYDLDGVPQFSFGSFGSGNGQFNSPYAVTTDGTHVYVTDTGNNRIQWFTMLGVYVGQTGSIGSSLGKFNAPLGIAVSEFFVWIVDSGNNRIQAMTFDGTVVYQQSTYTIGGTTYTFNAPTDCSADSEFLYVNDFGNGRIVVLPLTLVFEWVASVSLPMLSASGVFDGRWFSGDVTLPAIQASGEFTAKLLFSGNSYLPAFSANGEFTANGSFSGDATLPLLSVSGTFSSEVLFSGSATLPLFSASGTFTAKNILSADVSLPMFSASGVFESVLLGVYNAIAINTEIFAVTEYSNYNFNSMCEYNGKYYSASTSGVVRLDGTTDLGTAISPTVRFGTNDLQRGGVKILTDSYFIGKSQSGATATFVYNEHETRPIVAAIGDYENGGREGTRVRVPRGIKHKRFVSVQVTGAPEIDEYRLIIETVPGRVK